MRVRRPRIVFCTAAAVVAATGLSLVDAADAAPAAPGQGGTASARVCIEPAIRFGETPDAPSVVTRTIPGGLPAGRYRVSVTTSDGYAGRTETDFAIETSERVAVYGQVTQDLADGVESDTKTLVFEVSFAEPQTTVQVAHAPANGPDSVRVDQLCWERLGDAEISTSTSSTATTATTVPTSTTVATSTTAPGGGSTSTTLPGLVLQTVPGLIFVEGDPGTTTTTTACSGSTSAPGSTAAGAVSGSGGSSACPGGTTVLANQLPLAPTANAVTSSPAFTG